MKKNFTLLFCVALSLSVISCQKGIEEPGTTGTDGTETGNNAGAGDIKGTWKFISLDAKTSSTVQLVSGADVTKSITISEYITENNKGTVTFDATKFSTNNVSYDVNTVAKTTLYENGVLVDTLTIPMQLPVPSSSGSVPYTRIGSDSLYLQSGTSFMGGTTQSTQAGGAKIKLEQDKLYLMQSQNVTNTTTDQGATITTISAASIKVTMQRQ